MDFVRKNLHWVIRLYLAYVLIPIGWKKMGVMVNDMKFLGYLVGPFELFGPILILIGAFVKFDNQILTRLGGFMVLVIMSGAIYLHLITWGHDFSRAIPAIELFVISLYFIINPFKNIE
tara:strand:- start:1234 stop:1590 length:357 start_codon:yes stop_codon:yes gene_type:complete